jgi:hypothetical protein
MRLRIRTLQILIVLLAPPLGLICQGARFGCAGRILVAWGILVAAPLTMIGLSKCRIMNKMARDAAILYYATLGVGGYALAIIVSFIVIDVATWEF